MNRTQLVAARARRPNSGRGLILPAPRPYQQPVLESPARYKNVAAGRRWGKSTTGLVATVAGHGPRDRHNLPRRRGALQGGQIWWVVPDMPTTGRDRWRDLKAALRGIWTHKDETEKRIELPGGGAITVRSADDPDRLRGGSLDGVVVDEAAIMDETAWTEALRPALSDQQGWALFLSTPKDQANWWYRLFLRGADELELERLGVKDDPRRAGWESWRRPSSDNWQLTQPAEEGELTELEQALEDLGRLLFTQEYLADFIIVAGALFAREWFRYYDVIADGAQLVLEGDSPLTVARSRLRRIAAADLAVTTKTTSDYTVAATGGIVPVTGQLAILDLARGKMEGPDVPGFLQAHYRKNLPAYFGIESVAFQATVTQELRRRGLPVRAVKADRDKVTRALTLAARMESGQVFLPRWAPWLADLEAELLAFNPDDSHEHDDQVDTLAYLVLEAAGGRGRTLRSS